MKKKLPFLFLLGLLAIGTASVNHYRKTEVVDAAYTTNATTYYNSVGNLSGDALLEKLAELTTTNHKYYTTYDDIRTMNLQSDKDSKNSSNLLDFYSQISIDGTWDGGKTWNREHVWCQSHTNGLFGTSGAGSDIHHIRPTINSINSSRNNSLYGIVESKDKRDAYAKYYNKTNTTDATAANGTLYGYLNGSLSDDGVFEPTDNIKGDVARIVMYLYMHYSSEVSANLSRVNVSNSTTKSKAGALDISNIVYTSRHNESDADDAAFDLLVAWSESDPVDSFEANRNNYCASITGTRNPFIDHPEYASYIWGGSSNTGSGSGNDNSGSSGSTTPELGGDSSVEGDKIVIENTTTSKKYKLVTNAGNIYNNDKIIIAAKDYDVAMSTTQNTNNRGVSNINKYTSGGNQYLTPSSDTEILTVAKANSQYNFNTSSGGYLATASSSENRLVTKTSLGSGENAYWTVSVSGGITTVKAKGSYTRNILKYNHSSNIFSCYGEGNTQKDIEIYREIVETSTTTQTITLPKDGTLLSISQAKEYASLVGSSYTTAKYNIQGTITSITNTEYGNMYIQDASGNSIYVYGVYSSDGTARYDALPSIHKPQVGDTVTLYGVIGTYNSTPQMKTARLYDLDKSTSSTSVLNTLFTNYVGDKSYTKKSIINLNKEAVNDISKYFYASCSTLQRTTYYKNNLLLMGNYDGTLSGVTSTSGINSGYGTNANGDMVHFKVNSTGELVGDYVVDIPNNGGMEEFYTTPFDFTSSNYFDSSWIYDYNVGYTHIVTNTEKSKKYLQDFLDVAAPLLLSDIYNSNYVQIEKLVIKEVNNTLVLQIIVSSTNSGKLSNLISDSNVLAESVVTSECDLIYLQNY